MNRAPRPPMQLQLPLAELMDLLDSDLDLDLDRVDQWSQVLRHRPATTRPRRRI